ncbi:MAG TPA: family 16 glycosylhydrolase [Saprospiraceae bacterium]|nr:family 16 glycosylhydrolase [Saprospiraceae bacterium]
MMHKTGIAVVLLLSLLPGCKDEEKTDVSGFEAEVISLDEGAALNTQSLTLRVKGTLGKTIMVSYRLEEGTARAGDDFLATSGSLEFSPDKEEAVADVEIAGDQYLELTESFSLVLTYEGEEYPLTIDIADDDDVENILEDIDGYYTPDMYTSMRKVWQDEFDGSQLSATQWTYELGNGCAVGICGWGNNELESYTDEPANCRVEEGKLTITALESSGSYTSSRIKTQNQAEIQFGRIDIRARLPKGQGIWPAIWMLGENITTAGWPACGEIDIMELVGHQPAMVHGTVHYNSNGYMQSTGSKSLTEGDFSDRFHVFTIVWDRNEITWYVDNKPFKTFTNTNISGYPFNKPFFFILNIAVGGNWPGSPDATTVFPQEMVVDYIRVFQ